MKNINITIFSDQDFSFKIGCHSSFARMGADSDGFTTFYDMNLENYSEFVSYLQTALDGDRGERFIDSLNKVNLEAVSEFLTDDFFSMQLSHGNFYIGFSNINT